ncbi:MAG: ATP-dependent Clp protease proteolytic subunit [Patescibacteria group bacterium]
MPALKSNLELSLYARDSYERRVVLGDKFDDERSVEIMRELRRLDELSCEPIVVRFESNGGDYYPGERLASCIEGLGSIVIGIVYGHCFSTAMLVLQACNVRAALPTAKLLFHNNYKIVNVRLTPDSDITVLSGMLAQQIERRRQIREETITNLTRRVPSFTAETLSRLLQENDPTPRIMSAGEALLLGFLDGIVKI